MIFHLLRLLSTKALEVLITGAIALALVLWKSSDKALAQELAL